MHWADVLADELLKEDKKHVLATGITPFILEICARFLQLMLFLEQL